MSPRLAFALNTAYSAGRLTLGYFQNNPPTEIKEDATPVTAADKAAERLIREIIEKTYPTEGILGEEEGENSKGTTRWVVDPIDGTKSFVSGVPLYATLLSFEVEEEPVVGVCYFPALDLMLHAEKGQGAFVNGRLLQVSKKTEVKGSVISCGGHRSMLVAGRMMPFLKLAETALATRTWCDAYGHALVAMGQIDAMIEPKVARWDVSPLALIIREAGGKFTDFKGNNVITDEAITSNGLLHDELIAAFQ
jgi:histidinol phosphatase-like enzyme (inositol monophosphatase family)